ncbi:Uncharacterised protein [Acinetobacter baumannii]|nr:Uncharacterised protein [Acinetobacter baumannii]
MISKIFMPRTSCERSYLSAICPAVAEKKKYGKINNNAAKLLSVLTGADCC